MVRCVCATGSGFAVSRSRSARVAGRGRRGRGRPGPRAGRGLGSRIAVAVGQGRGSRSARVAGRDRGYRGRGSRSARAGRRRNWRPSRAGRDARGDTMLSCRLGDDEHSPSMVGDSPDGSSPLLSTSRRRPRSKCCRPLRRDGSDRARRLPCRPRSERELGRRYDVRHRVGAQSRDGRNRLRSLRLLGPLGLWRRLHVGQRLRLGMGAVPLRALGQCCRSGLVMDSGTRIRARVGFLASWRARRRVRRVGAGAPGFRLARRSGRRDRLWGVSALRLLRIGRAVSSPCVRAFRAGAATGRNRSPYAPVRRATRRGWPLLRTASGAHRHRTRTRRSRHRQRARARSRARLRTSFGRCALWGAPSGACGNESRRARRADGPSAR